MSGVIIEELDNSSEDSFGTTKSEHSADEFHEAEADLMDKAEPAASQKDFRGSKAIHHKQPEVLTTSQEKQKEGEPGAGGVDVEAEASATSPEEEHFPNGSEATAAATTSASLQETIAEAEKLKAEGNKLYIVGDYLEALESYKQALDILPDSAAQQRAVLFANSGAVRIKLEEYAEAAKDCSACLNLEPPQNLQIKALTRRSLAYEKVDDLDRALADYEKLVSLDGSNASNRAAVRRLKPIVEERREKMKDEMIGKLKDLGNTVLGKFGMSLDNFKAEKDPNTGSYSINFKQ